MKKSSKKKPKKQSKKIAIVISIVVIALITTIFFVLEAGRTDLDRARKAYKKGKYQEALEFYLTAYEAGNESEEIYIEIADTYVALDDYDKAIKILEKGYADSHSELIIEKEKQLYYEMGVASQSLEFPFDIYDIKLLSNDLIADNYENICEKLGVEINIGKEGLQTVDTEYGGVRAWIDDSQGVRTKNLIVYDDYQLMLQVIEGYSVFLKVESSPLCSYVEGNKKISDALSFPLFIGDSAEKCREVFAEESFKQIHTNNDGSELIDELDLPEDPDFLDGYCQWGNCSYYTVNNSEENRISVDINGDKLDIRYSVWLDENECIDRFTIESDFIE